MATPEEATSADRPPPKAPKDKTTNKHLANERTFLAWVRTCVTVISLGFVVAKFGLWLEQSAGAGAAPAKRSADWSAPLGSAIMAAGAGLCLLAAWRYRRASRDIESGQVRPAAGVVTFVTCFVVLLAAAMIIYLAHGAGR